MQEYQTIFGIEEPCKVFTPEQIERIISYAVTMKECDVAIAQAKAGAVIAEVKANEAIARINADCEKEVARLKAESQQRLYTAAVQATASVCGVVTHALPLIGAAVSLPTPPTMRNVTSE